MPTLRTAPTWLARFATAVASSAGWSIFGLGGSPSATLKRLSAELGELREVFGDATRGGEWAARPARPSTATGSSRPTRRGSTRPLAGLTLLEAAAVGGEPLAVEALASALGQVFAAAPRPGRVAVAMSGGVDSAVALLRAGPDAVGVTLRLWQDPRGAGRRARVLLACRGGRRARDVPRARPAARDARPARGVQGDGRRAVRARLRGGGDAEPVHALQRGVPLRRARSPSPSVRARTSCGPATTPASSSARACRLVARAADEPRTSRTCSPRSSPALLERVRFPLGEQTKDETRAEAGAAGLAAAGRPESQEACFLAGDDYRAFLERQGLASAEGPIVDEDGARARHATTATGASRPASAAGSASRRPRRCTSCGRSRATNTVVVGPRDVARGDDGRGARARCTSPVARGRGEAALPLGARRRARVETRRRLRARARASRRTASRRGQVAVAVRRRMPSSAPGRSRPLPECEPTRIRGDDRARVDRRRRPRLRPRGLLRRERARARVHASSASAGRSRGSRRSSRAPSATCCP